MPAIVDPFPVCDARATANERVQMTRGWDLWCPVKDQSLAASASRW
jgi:hypothetical protein